VPAGVHVSRQRSRALALDSFPRRSTNPAALLPEEGPPTSGPREGGPDRGLKKKLTPVRGSGTLADLRYGEQRAATGSDNEPSIFDIQDGP
jgi:hypothetical protein